MHGAVLDGREVGLGVIRCHVTDLHLEQLLVRLADERAGCVVRGDVVAVVVPHEDSDVAEERGGLTQERDL